MILIDTEFKYYQAGITFRNGILRIPLGQDMRNEDLSDEKEQIHILHLKEDEILGYVILVPNYKPNTGKLRQMATAEKVRGQGIGVALVKALEQHALSLGMDTITLHSRHYAVGFYQKLGYQIDSPVFQEVGMDHYVMTKTISL